MSDYKEENSYSNILKRMSSFGGVQIFNILINIIKGKLVAMILGPQGMGISSLFTSSAGTLQQAGSLGLNLAIVKEVAAGKDDPEALPHIMAVAIRLLICSAIFGGVICIVFSPILSRWTFGDSQYTLSFIFLAVSVSLSIAGAGYLSLLQGLSEVKRLSKASVVGGLTGLFCGVPLYYFLGTSGIVPAIIIQSFTIFLFYFISFQKAFSGKAQFRWKEHRPMVKRLISLGLILMIGSLVGTAANYLINLFIRIFGSVENVGLFQAANSLTNQYVGVVFSALALDYYPRLSAICHDTEKLRNVVNRQTEIVMLAITPLSLLLIFTAPLVIEIFLTKEFLVVTPLMRWMGFGMFIESTYFPLGYIFIAKEDKRAYLWYEVVFTNLLWIACSVIFYRLFALTGLGISLAVRGAISWIVTFGICFRLYKFKYNADVMKTVIISILMVTAGFILSFYETRHSYIIYMLISITSIIYSAFMIKNRLTQN